MKIRYGDNLVVFFDILFGILLMWISSLSYFLGFDINSKTLFYYAASLLIVILICVCVYVGYILLCRTFIVFTDEAIIKIKKDKIILEIEYSKIWNAKYYPIIDWFVGGTKGGNLIIKTKDREFFIPISKKNLKNIKRIPVRIIDRQLTDIFNTP